MKNIIDQIEQEYEQFAMNPQTIEEQPQEKKEQDHEQQQEESADAGQERQEEVLEQEEEEDQPGEDQVDPSSEEDQQKSRMMSRISAKKRAADAEKALREKELELARLRGQQEILLQQNKKEEAPAPKQEVVDPEPEQGTYEHDQWMARQAVRKAEALEKRLEEMQARAAYVEAEKVWMERDKASSENDAAYASSMKFLRTQMRQTLKEQYPSASALEIERAAKEAEYGVVARMAAQGLDPEPYFKGLAASYGFNPFADVHPKLVQNKDPRPKVDKSEVQFHKRNSGSVVASPAGEAKQMLTERSISRAPLKALMEIDEADWSYMLAEARRNHTPTPL